MKRLVSLFLILVLGVGLCACGVGEAEETPHYIPYTEPSTEPTTEPTTVPTEPPVVYRNPLNGTVLQEEYTGRPVAAVINNLDAALPQSGLETADFLFEAETEGGITRFLVVYSDVENAGVIGPVRSARTFFNNLALSFDAPIVHCGGSVRGRNGYADRDGGKISDWEHLNEQSYGGYFYRDQDRLSSGYSREHTLFTTGENLVKGFEKAEISLQQPVELGYSFDEAAAVDGFLANNVTVNFRNSKKTEFTYNADTGLYTARQYGEDLIDGTTGNQVAFKNLVVVYADQSFRHDGEYSRSYYVLEGEGTGELVIDGKIANILWTREDQNSPFVFTYEDGTPVTFGVGKTYVAINCDEKGSVDFSE